MAVTCGVTILAICVSAGLAWHFLQPKTTEIDSTGDKARIDAHGALIESLSLLNLSNNSDGDEPTTAGLSVK